MRALIPIRSMPADGRLVGVEGDGRKLRDGGDGFSDVQLDGGGGGDLPPYAFPVVDSGY